MGCAESRQQHHQPPFAQPLLSDFDRRQQEPEAYGFSMPTSPRMGQPQLLPQISWSSSVQLSTQHERLILELLPFKDVRQFHEWLNSVYVRGSWNEFLRDFLSRNPLAPEPDKTKIAQLAKDTVNSRNPKYLIYHPDKTDWTSDDHHVRFMATVINDNMAKGLWTESDWKKKNLDIAKAMYEVLSFLRATAPAGSDVNPPRYDG